MMRAKRYMVIERRTFARRVTYVVVGVTLAWDGTQRTELREYRTFRGAKAYAARMLSTPLVALPEAGAA